MVDPALSVILDACRPLAEGKNFVGDGNLDVFFLVKGTAEVGRLKDEI